MVVVTSGKATRGCCCDADKIIVLQQSAATAGTGLGVLMQKTSVCGLQQWQLTMDMSAQ